MWSRAVFHRMKRLVPARPFGGPPFDLAAAVDGVGTYLLLHDEQLKAGRLRLLIALPYGPQICLLTAPGRLLPIVPTLASLRANK